jgi:hypothetical protein
MAVIVLGLAATERCASTLDQRRAPLLSRKATRGNIDVTLNVVTT